MAAALRACLPADASVEWTERFLAPPLDTNDEVAAFLAHTGLTEGDDVDFWTEAALFHQAGHPTIVLGPGNIAQAHQADEWVAIDSLVPPQGYTHTIKVGVPEVTMLRDIVVNLLHNLGGRSEVDRHSEYAEGNAAPWSKWAAV